MMTVRDGLMYRTWENERPRAVYLAVHGLGAHSGRWDFFGTYASRRGCAVYSLELRGFGQTQDRPRGHIGSFQTYYRDVVALGGIIRRDYPGVPIILIGESMGGLIAYRVALERKGMWGGLVCMSPAIKSRLLFPWFAYLDIFTSFYLFPRRQYRLPFSSKMCTRDAAYEQVMDASAAENRWATARMLGNIFLAQHHVSIMPGAVDCPVLFVYAGADMMVEPKATESLFARLSAPDKAIKKYPEMRHALSVDVGREQVFDDIFGWVDHHGAASA